MISARRIPQASLPAPPPQPREETGQDVPVEGAGRWQWAWPLSREEGFHSPTPSCPASAEWGDVLFLEEGRGEPFSAC